MEEIQSFLIRLAIALVGATLIGASSYAVARRKGRDTVGWYLTSFIPALFGFLALLLAFPKNVAWYLSGILVTILPPGILLALPPIETPGQTRRCGDCGRIIGWNVDRCPGCGSAAGVPQRPEGTRVRRPLRSCFLYVSLFILLLLIVFGLIGYFCVPNEPRVKGVQSDLPLHGSKGK
jgi:hypothetical protein